MLGSPIKVVLTVEQLQGEINTEIDKIIENDQGERLWPIARFMLGDLRAFSVPGELYLAWATSLNRQGQLQSGEVVIPELHPGSDIYKATLRVGHRLAHVLNLKGIQQNTPRGFYYNLAIKHPGDSLYSYLDTREFKRPSHVGSPSRLHLEADLMLLQELPKY